MNILLDLFQSVSNSFTAIGRIPSLGLIILLFAGFAELVLAIAVIRSDIRSATNQIFFFLSMSTIGWLVMNYLGYVPQFYPETLLVARFGIFFAAPMSSLFFLFAHTMPSPTIRLRRSLFWLTIAATAVMMGLNLSPYAFTNATSVMNGAVHPVPAAGFIPFAVLSTLFSVLALWFLIRKIQKSSGEEQAQARTVLWGILVMLALITVTILVPILLFDSATFLVLAPIYTLVFLAAAAYAIVKHQLFNIKVIATEALTFALWITLFSNIFAAGTNGQRAVDGLVFLLTVGLGIVLVRSVRAEIRQREELQQLNNKLDAANTQLQELSRFKSQLLSLASHQLRSPLAAIKGFGSLIISGSYGEVPDKVKETVGKMQKSTDELLSLINTLLDLRKVEEGKMEYQFAPTNVKTLATDVVELMKPVAQAKGLELTLVAPAGDVMVSADAEKFKQVIQNLVDNAIKYTPTGFVRVELTTDDERRTTQNGMAVISITDSGLGMPQSLIPYLFEEFIRDERVKKQVLGTGLGLYIAKKIAESHGGTIMAESPGEGKGSTFRVTVPLAKA